MFDSLDDQYRWCIFCKADCWPEQENQEHAADCPQSTNLWPVSDDDYKCEMCCCMCSERFDKDSHSVLVDAVTGEITTLALVSTVICIGCAAAISILGVRYEG